MDNEVFVIRRYFFLLSAERRDVDARISRRLGVSASNLYPRDLLLSYRED